MVNKINLGFVNYSAGTGGIETLILEICRRLDNNKYNLFFFIFEQGGELIKEYEEIGVNIIFIEKKKGLDIILPSRLSKQFKATGCHIIHTHNPFSWLYGGTAAKIAGIPLVHTEHTNADYYSHHVKRWILLEWMLSFITFKITTVAGSVADFMINKQCINKDKIQVIYNGIDQHKFGISIDIEHKKREIGLNPNDIIIGNVSRFYPNKDHDNLIKAFEILSSKFTGARLLLVGDGPLKSQTEQTVDNIGLKDKVIFLGNRRDIPELLPTFDVFALSSLREGFPVVLLEAMASKIPTVVTDVDGNAELVENGKTGLIVPPSDPVALSSAILNVIDNKATAEKMGTEGRKRVVDNFSFDAMMNKYESLYKSALH